MAAYRMAIGICEYRRLADLPPDAPCRPVFARHRRLCHILHMLREYVRRFPESAQDSLGFELYRVQCGFDPKDWRPMTGIGTGVKEIRVRDEAGIFRMIYLATRPEGGVCVSKDEPFGFGSSDEKI
jgi:hypothetical protein